MTEGTYAVKVLRRLADEMEGGVKQTPAERLEQSRKAAEYKAEMEADHERAGKRTNPDEFNEPRRSILIAYQRHVPGATIREALTHYNRVIREFWAMPSSSGKNGSHAKAYYDKLMTTPGIDIHSFSQRDDD